MVPSVTAPFLLRYEVAYSSTRKHQVATGECVRGIRESDLTASRLRLALRFLRREDAAFPPRDEEL